MQPLSLPPVHPLIPTSESDVTVLYCMLVCQRKGLLLVDCPTFVGVHHNGSAGWTVWCSVQPIQHRHHQVPYEPRC